MKKVSLAVLFACCTLALSAQDAIRVKYQGAKPNIMDFSWAYLFDDIENEEECDQEAFAGVRHALSQYRERLPQEEGATLTVDLKNGYILYEWEDENNSKKTEMCYWNESDGKHKLFAYNTWYYVDGKPALGQYDGLTFWRYNNATKKMSMCEAPGFEVEYQNTTYSLPRVGKDIIVTKWDDKGRKKQKTLKWNGRGFTSK